MWVAPTFIVWFGLIFTTITTATKSPVKFSEMYSWQTEKQNNDEHAPKLFPQLVFGSKNFQVAFNNKNTSSCSLN